MVDDEASIRFLLAEELTEQGYEVSTAASGEEALAILQDHAFDLMLLDLRMPGVNGLQVMEAARDLAPDTVVIMLTAHATLDSAIEAMRYGGHDYLLKPSATEEILASVDRGLAKRRRRLREEELIRQMGDIVHQLGDGKFDAREKGRIVRQPSRFLRVGDLLLDREKPGVSLAGKPLDLTPSEFKLLLCLMESRDRTVSFRELAQAIHGPHSEEVRARDAISTHMWRLRRKLKAVAPGKAYIVSVRGQGYRLCR